MLALATKIIRRHKSISNNTAFNGVFLCAGQKESTEQVLKQDCNPSFIQQIVTLPLQPAFSPPQCMMNHKHDCSMRIIYFSSFCSIGNIPSNKNNSPPASPTTFRSYNSLTMKVDWFAPTIKPFIEHNPTVMNPFKPCDVKKDISTGIFLDRI